MNLFFVHKHSGYGTDSSCVMATCFLLRNGMCRSYFFCKTCPSPKKRRLSTSLAECFICQKSLEGLTTPGDVGYSTFVKVSRFRFEAGEEELYKRLESFLDEGCTSIHEQYRSQIKWLHINQK